MNAFRAQTFGDPCLVDPDCEGGAIVSGAVCFGGRCTKTCLFNTACLIDAAYTPPDQCTSSQSCDTTNNVCRLDPYCETIGPVANCALSFACSGNTCVPDSDNCAPPANVCETITCDLFMGVSYECLSEPVICPNPFNPMDPCTIYPPCDNVNGCVSDTLVCNSPGNGVCFTEECSTTTPGTCEQTPIPYVVPPFIDPNCLVDEGPCDPVEGYNMAIIIICNSPGNGVCFNEFCSPTTPGVCEQTPIPFTPPLGVDPNCIVDSGPCDPVNGYDSPTIVDCNVLNDDPCGIYACEAGTHACVKTGENTDNVFLPTGDVCGPYINCQTGAITSSDPVSVTINNSTTMVINSTNPNVLFLNRTKNDGSIVTSVIVQDVTDDITISIPSIPIIQDSVLRSPSVAIIVQTRIQNITDDEAQALIPYTQVPGLVNVGTQETVSVSGCGTDYTNSVSNTEGYSCVQDTGFDPIVTLSTELLELCIDELIRSGTSRSFLQLVVGDLTQPLPSPAFIQACREIGVSFKRSVMVSTSTNCQNTSNGTITVNVPIDPDTLTNSSTVVIDIEILPIPIEELIEVQIHPQINRTAYECTLSRCTWVFNNQYCNTTDVETRWPSSFCGLTEQELYELEVQRDMWFFGVNNYLALRNSYVCTVAFESDVQLKAEVESALDAMVVLLSDTCEPVLESTMSPVSYDELKNATDHVRAILNDTACDGEIEFDRVCPLTENQLAQCNGTVPIVSNSTRPKTVECRQTPFGSTGVSYYTFVSDALFSVLPVPSPTPTPSLGPSPSPSPELRDDQPVIVFLISLLAVVVVVAMISILFGFTRR